MTAEGASSMKLVFIHGSGAIGEVWHYQKEHFKGSDAPDLPGHPEGKLCTSMEEYSDWLHWYFQGKGYKDVVLAGHSLGGGIALQHAIKYPGDLKAVILIGSGARLRVLPQIIEAIKGKLDDRQGWLKQLVIPLYATVDEKTRELLLPKLTEVGPAPQLNDFLCCDKFDIMEKAGSITLPVLAIVGDQDNMTPPKYAQYMVKNLPACRMEMIEGGTHLAFLEKPKQVNAAIEKFLKEIS
jgi:pimeloyl-ACP methyl ester carboxylesterase